MVSTSAPQGRETKGSVPTRHRKQSEPITTRVEMNISSGSSVIWQSSSFDHSTLYLVPPPTYPAPINVLQSPRSVYISAIPIYKYKYNKTKRLAREARQALIF